LFHCAQEVVEGAKTIEDCQKAPSPIVPATNELIWGGLAFVLLAMIVGYVRKLRQPARAAL